jgi:hypothetical protein
MQTIEVVGRRYRVRRFVTQSASFDASDRRAIRLDHQPLVESPLDLRDLWI